MPVDGGHETEAHGPTNGLGNLALVDGSQTSLFTVFDATERGNILGHDREVLELNEALLVIEPNVTSRQPQGIA